MKQFSKKISSLIMALAVGLSLSPATGLTILADETETDVPEVTSEAEPEKQKEPETSKEPKAPTESELPKETEATKESEAPKESETPKEAETPKKPDASASSKPKNLHVNTGTITGIKIDENGKLTWDSYDRAEIYFVAAYGNCIYYGNGLSTDNINNQIDQFIRNCAISKKSAYKIDITAFDGDYSPIAKGSYTYTYASTAVASKLAKVKNASINKKGLLKWKAHKSAMYYVLYINGIECSSTEGGYWKFNLPYLINCSIESGILTKASSNKYTIKIVGLTASGKPLDQWSKTYKYKSKATPIKYYDFDYDDISINSGVIKWTKVPKAAAYGIQVMDDNGNEISCEIKSNSFDMNAYLSSSINRGFISKNGYDIKLIAYYKYQKIAELFLPYSLEKLPADLTAVKGNTAKISYKKLKKKAQTLAVSKAIAGVSTPGSTGKFIFTKESGDKAISVNPDTGKITIKKKGLKKKTYSVRVKVSISDNMNYGYEAQEKTVTFKIKVTK